MNTSDTLSVGTAVNANWHGNLFSTFVSRDPVLNVTKSYLQGANWLTLEFGKESSIHYHTTELTTKTVVVPNQSEVKSWPVNQNEFWKKEKNRKRYNKGSKNDLILGLIFHHGNTDHWYFYLNKNKPLIPKESCTQLVVKSLVTFP